MIHQNILNKYEDIAGRDVIEHLRQLARPLNGLRLVHVNSTRVGGGVAEILHKMVPLMEELGIRTRWEVIEGESRFYQCTKNFHNAMQGIQVNIPESYLRVYEETNAKAAEKLKEVLEEADIVVVHDPQPAALIKYFPNHRGKWVWRCHIDASRPFRQVWRYLVKFVSQYDASVFSLSSLPSVCHIPYILSHRALIPFMKKM